MKIEKTVLQHLDSFEVSQLERLLETIEANQLYLSGMDKFTGGYANAEAYELIEGDDYDEATDQDVDVIEIEIEVGENTGSFTKCTKSCYRITRNILTNPSLSVGDMLQKVKEL